MNNVRNLYITLSLAVIILLLSSCTFFIIRTIQTILTRITLLIILL